VALLAGANDFGGTLMEESISNAAGSEHGDHLDAEEIVQLIRQVGRAPYERTTTYGRRERPAAALAARGAPLPVLGERPPLALANGY
jgi:2-iminoacetate synthase ThiH